MSNGHTFHRGRRLRRTPAIRSMVRETRLSPDTFMFPIFVTHGKNVREPIEPMPGIAQLSVDNLKAEVDEIASLGIPSVLLFGIPESKDSRGTGGYAKDGIVQNAVREIKSAQPDLVVTTDVCMCEYTDHGHCGILLPNGEVNNDETLPLLAETAVSHVEAGADIVAPSAMMDGQIAAIRAGLDSAGHTETTLMAYAAKYSSAFYGPFRVAADSAPKQGDRRSYQMDPANGREAMREVRADIAEGADIVMVKPALEYLDIIRMARRVSEVPVAAYNVSGEYSMLKAAAQNGWIDEDRAIIEVLTSISRAGADIIITYHAKEAIPLIDG
ncbi:MAG: porphobilinogen synthase [Chloroflexi bacterium]|nr:porphobilinogen synthase [Chloroflexota bacterium]